MKAYLLNGVHDLRNNKKPLRLVELDRPLPGPGEILVQISCCGVCHTELDEIEGRTPPPVYPVIPGHQVIGVVQQSGANSTRFKLGNRVGIAWIHSACGECNQCGRGLENLCDQFKATGRDVNGGYAEYMTVHEDFAYLIPPGFSDEEAAPLLCAGAIGFRSLTLAALQNGQTLGLSGFGASGHLVLKLARHLHPDSEIFVFARSPKERKFAMSLGASWAGDTGEQPPKKLWAIIDTTPVWKPVVQSLLNLERGGRLIINAIRKESIDKDELLDLSYEDHLWMEKEIKSVANITRNDVEMFLAVAASIPIRPVIEVYPFDQANKALLDLKQKHIKGAKVLRI